MNSFIRLAGFALAGLFPISALRMAPVGERLEMTPSAAPAGTPLRLTYHPMSPDLAAEDSLIVRARMRTPIDPMYEVTRPLEQIRAVSVLRKNTAGDFVGVFTLPRGYVFAALAIADARAAHVDDNGSRTWEVLAHTRDGKPEYDALSQRASDYMGRSWEEGYASAKRLAELYPMRPGAWMLREFFEKAIYGSSADSVKAVYRDKLNALIAHAKTSNDISEDELESLYFREYVNATNSKSPEDSAEMQYWWARILREAPKSAQIAQRLAFEVDQLPSSVSLPSRLDSLEALWRALAPVRGAGRNLINVGSSIASRANDDAAILRWVERSEMFAPDSALRVALAMSTRPSLRAQGMTSLRTLLSATADTSGIRWERLGETAAGYRRRVRTMRSSMFAALGRALIAEGKPKAGADTLKIAANGIWDVALFTDISRALASAGDSAASARMMAKIVADNRTRPTVVDSLTSVGRAALGAATWDSLTTTARAEMYARTLETAMTRPVVGSPKAINGDGQRFDLSALTEGKVTVVMFWSRYCGAAMEALPSIVSAAAQLKARGTPLVFVVEDDAPASDIGSFLAAKGLKTTLYYDTDGEMAKGFNNFGTPTFYVLDGAGKVRYIHNTGSLLVSQISALEGVR